MESVLFYPTLNDEMINEEFQSAWDEKQKHYDSLSSERIWAKEQNSFFTLPKRWDLIPSVQKITQENIEALVELDRCFKSQGIQFIIQIVPYYYDIAALVLNPTFKKYGDQRSARVVQQLLEHGIEVQYLSDEIINDALKYERLYCYPNPRRSWALYICSWIRFIASLILFTGIFM